MVRTRLWWRRGAGRWLVASLAAWLLVSGGGVPAGVQAQPFPAPVETARQMLANDLGTSPDAVAVVSIEETEWPDSSLGCPQPGMSYTQATVPGYVVVLEAGGTQYTYHTGREDGVVRCDQPAAPAVPSPPSPPAPPGVPPPPPPPPVPPPSG